MHHRPILTVLCLTLLLASCASMRRRVREEVLLSDGSSRTGRIERADSGGIALRQADKSLALLPWAEIDSVRGLRLATMYVGLNAGFAYTPYFSVFRNEGYQPSSLLVQGKVGWARRDRVMRYLHYSWLPAAQPYRLNKIGYGFQRYVWQGYTRPQGVFLGGEFNLLKAEYNNGRQIILEPFVGYERQFDAQCRFHARIGTQLNPVNKNGRLGFTASVGVHFLLRDLQRPYRDLLQDHTWEGR
jgi:hypothetical protein